MFLTNVGKAKPVKRAPLRPSTCTNCDNTSDHRLYWWEEGRFVRFAGIHVAGRKGYGYVCEVCGSISEVLTKEQARSLAG